MFCSKCGREVKDEWASCPKCGNSLKNNIREEIHIKEATKNYNKIWLMLGILVGGILLIVALVMGVLFSGDSDLQTELSQTEQLEVIDKLSMFTTVYQGDGKYYFLDNNEEWLLTYTRENEFVTFENTVVTECCNEAFGEGCFSGDDILDLGFSYDLGDNEARIYLDVDTEDGHLSIINYYLEEKEYELMIDAEKWSPAEEFADFLNEYGLGETIERDVEEFEEALQQHNLSIEELLGVEYTTLNLQFVVGIETTEKVEANQNENCQNEGEVLRDEQTDLKAQESVAFGWKEAYAEYLYQNGDIDYEYSLDYIDEDEVPELIIDCMNAADGMFLCTYDDGNVIATPVGEAIQYRRQENMICASGGRMDHYYNILYEIIDGVPIETSKGEYGILDSQNMKYDEEGCVVYEYSWNGERVSEYEYYSYLDVFYSGDESTAICYPGSGYLYDVIEVLSHPLDITIISPYLNSNGYSSSLNHYVVLFDGIEDDKLHFTVTYNDSLIGSASATIIDSKRAEYRNANSELIIEFGLNYGILKIEGYMDKIDLTGSYYGLWG